MGSPSYSPKDCNSHIFITHRNYDLWFTHYFESYPCGKLHDWVMSPRFTGDIRVHVGPRFTTDCKCTHMSYHITHIWFIFLTSLLWCTHTHMIQWHIHTHFVTLHIHTFHTQHFMDWHIHWASHTYTLLYTQWTHICGTLHFRVHTRTHLHPKRECSKHPQTLTTRTVSQNRASEHRACSANLTTPRHMFLPLALAKAPSRTHLRHSPQKTHLPQAFTVF